MMYYKKELEEKAFKLGGSNYNAPIQRFEDFEKNKKSTFIGYAGGIMSAAVDGIKCAIAVL